MAKQLNVNMSFTADTGQAKQAILDLQKDIQKLAYGNIPTNKLIDPAQFEAASAAARELAFHLNNAYNAKTGNLDLAKLNSSLKDSGTSLTALTQNFSAAGSVGQKAFISLANAVANADMPALSLNTHLQTMLVTLKNVARFQISSSIIHGAMGAMQKAYGYAQDLNTSLNNIQIVTGQSANQMAAFAEQANKSARALSTSTLDYTKASLIYYQQGLSDAEVKARTDITVKLANITRQSAQDVSDQMTAIWNNFAKGGENLEYYADVITALGAATASSSSEIATGLEKFAAIADTVGLSYENATAALATIVATTRQSAETVGTGLRTVFSRLQSLKLGETLEDGVDLNKYSKALATVGVQALDTSGELRSMDQVLSDLSLRWQALSKAQKTALAQTVGGVRQYTTIMALMNNWDFMQENQQVAANAKGTLQQQSEIYAKGWEAARDRVKTAGEAIYKTLINEEAFIKIDNFLEHLLVGVNRFLEGIGGVKGLLVSVGGILSSMLASKIGPAFSKVIQDLQILTGGADKVYTKMQEEMQSIVSTQINQGSYTLSQQQELHNAEKLLEVRGQLSTVQNRLSPMEKMRAELAIQGLQLQQQSVLELADSYDELTGKQEVQTDKIKSYKSLSEAETAKMYALQQRKISQTQLQPDATGKLNTQVLTPLIDKTTQAMEMLSQARTTLIDTFLEQGSTIDINLAKLFNFDISDLSNQVQNITVPVKENLEVVKTEMQDAFLNLATDLKLDNQQFDSLYESLYGDTGSLDAFKAKLKELGIEGKESVQQFLESFSDFDAVDLSSIKHQVELLAQGFGDIGNQAPQVNAALAAIAQAKTPKQLLAGLNDLKNALEQSNVNAENLVQTLANLGIPKEALEAWQKNDKSLEELITKLKQEQDKLQNTKLDFSHMVTGTEVFAKLGSGAMSAYTIINSLQNLISTWEDPDLTFGEKLTSSLMSVGMAIPAIINLISVFTTLSAAHRQVVATSALMGATLETTNATIATSSGEAAAAAGIEAGAHALVKAGMDAEVAAKAAAILQNAALTGSAGTVATVEALVSAGVARQVAARMALTAAVGSNSIAAQFFAIVSGKVDAKLGQQTGTLWGNTAAWIANQIAKHGVAGIAVGAAIVAAIVATTAVIMANTAEVNRNTQAQLEYAKASREAADAAAESRDKEVELEKAYKNKYKAYQEAIDSGEGVTEASEALQTAALDVAKAYEIENAQLLIAAGLYDELTDKIQKASKAKAEAARQSAGQSLNSTAVEYGARQTENIKGAYWGDRDTIGIGDGSWAGFLGYRQNEESLMYQAAKNLRQNNAYGNFITVNPGERGSSGDLLFTTASRSAEGYIQMYEAVEATVKEAVKLAEEAGGTAMEDLQKSEIYLGSLKYLENMKETYTALVGAKDQLADISLDEVFINEDDITTVDQYNASLEKYIDILKNIKDQFGNRLFTDEQAKQTAESYLQTAYPELTALAQAEGVLAPKSSQSLEDAKKEFSQLWESSSEIGRTAILKEVAAASLLGKTIPVSELAAAAAEAEALAASLQKAAGVSFFQNINTKAKKGKTTTAEWGTIYDSNPDLFTEVSKADFLLMTDAEKAAYAHERSDVLKQESEAEAKQRYDTAKGKNSSLYNAAQQASQARNQANKALQEYIDNNAHYQMTDKQGRTYAVSATNRTKILGLQNKLDEIRANNPEGYSSSQAFLDTQVLFNEAIREATGADIGAFAEDALEKMYLIEDGQYKSLKEAADKAETKATQAATMYSDNQKIVTDYEIEHPEQTPEQKAAEQQAKTVEDILTAAEDAGLDTEDVKAYADKLSKIYQDQSRETLLQLASDTLSKAEDSGIGVKKLLEYNNTLSQLDQFSGMAADDLMNLTLSLSEQAEASGIGASKLIDYIESLNQAELFSNLTGEELGNLALLMQQTAEKTGLNADEIANYTNYLMQLPGFTKMSSRETMEFAVGVLKMNRGLKNLSSSGKTWLNNLKKYPKAATESKDAVAGLSDALADITGLDKKKFSRDWLLDPDNAKLVEDALTGETEAVQALQAALGKEGLQGAKDQLGDSFNDIKAAYDDFVENRLPDLEVGASINDTAFYQSLANMVSSGKMTIDQLNGILSGVGMEVETEEVTLPNDEYGKMVQKGVFTDEYGAQYPVSGESVTQGSSETTFTILKGAKYKGTGGGGGSGGGGGGGNKEPHKPKRYRNITNQIQNNDRKINSTSRKKDRAFGTEKLDLLKQERDLREENLKLQQQYQSEIEDWLDKDKDAMMEAFSTIGFTPIFDEAGEVINNDEFEKAFEAIGDGSDETWKKAEEALAQYEETLDLLNDKLEEIQELQDAIYDAALEATKLKLDLQLDILVDRFEYLDYLLDKIDDDAYQAAEAIALVGEKTAETMKKVNTYTAGLEDILSRHGFSLSDLDNLSVEDLQNAGFTQTEIDQIKEWRSELLTANKDLLEMRKTIVEKVISALNDLNEKVQKSYDKFDAYNSVLEKYKNITDLMGRNMSAQSRQIMNQLSNTMLRNAQNTAAAARRIYEDAELEMAQAQLAYQLAVSSGDQEAIRHWQEVIDATSEHLQEAEEQWLDSWNNALEQAKTMFEDTMEQIQEDYSATMGSTFGSLDYLQAAYDRQKEIGEMYERDFDRLYDLSKLSRDISKAIDDNDNIQGKQKLRALQAEINKLQADGTRLSEYDVEVLRKKFELEQARLALDDAQNAKSQVRLQRDANGNWGYVYTANEDKIAEAEQAYEDKLHEYQVLNDDYINQLQDKALEVQQTWSEVVGEIYSDLGLGVITDEEAAARLEEANQWLNEQRAYFEEQSNHALENQASLYDRTLNTYHVASAEIVDTWDETNLALLTKIDELQAYMNNWNEASETFLNHSAEVIDKYKEDIDKINDMAGISTTKFENHIDNVVVNINDMSDDTLTSVNDLSDTMRNEFSSALSEAVNWELQYVNAMDAMINRNETFVKSLNLMIEKLAGVNTSITEMLTPLETLDNIINQSTTPVYYQNSLSELTGTSAQHILSLLNANIAAYSAGLGELSMSGVNGLSTAIDQNVTITASFPNATNHSEIEEAFTNLINKASQYANRKGL